MTRNTTAMTAVQPDSSAVEPMIGLGKKSSERRRERVAEEKDATAVTVATNTVTPMMKKATASTLGATVEACSGNRKRSASMVILRVGRRGGRGARVAT